MKNYSKRIASKLFTIVTTILVLSISDSLYAAGYHGKDVDGETFNCTAFSYGTGRYYYGQVEFNGDEASLYISNGGRVVLTLNDDEIDDPSSISAFDYKRGVYWDLEVDELD